MAKNLFNIAGNIKPANAAGVKCPRFIQPHGCEEINEWRVKYSNAEQFASNIGDLNKGDRIFALCAGWGRIGG